MMQAKSGLALEELEHDPGPGLARSNEQHKEMTRNMDPIHLAKSKNPPAIARAAGFNEINEEVVCT